jgi:hypothetical protein
MPNICYNWASFSGSVATLAALRSTPLDLPEAPAGTDAYDWTVNTCGTKWICNESRNGLPEWSGDATTGLTVSFDSAWNPPIGFYRLLVKQYPDLTIHYEYHSWESGIIGYGIEASIPIFDMSNADHCTYNTAEELRAFVKGRTWIVSTMNPHFEDATAT